MQFFSRKIRIIRNSRCLYYSRIVNGLECITIKKNLIQIDFLLEKRSLNYMPGESDCSIFCIPAHLTLIDDLLKETHQSYG